MTAKLPAPITLSGSHVRLEPLGRAHVPDLFQAVARDEEVFGRVMWKTDHLIERSQNAIRRLGAAYEGTFRRAKRRPDGSWRDSVHFSMLADEWPEAKAHLTGRLAAGS